MFCMGWHYWLCSLWLCQKFIFSFKLLPRRIFFAINPSRNTGSAVLIGKQYRPISLQTRGEMQDCLPNQCPCSTLQALLKPAGLLPWIGAGVFTTVGVFSSSLSTELLLLLSELDDFFAAAAWAGIFPATINGPGLAERILFCCFVLVTAGSGCLLETAVLGLPFSWTAATATPLPGTELDFWAASCRKLVDLFPATVVFT